MNANELIITTENGRASTEERAHSASQSDLISSYRVAEFVTLARDGSPVCWPLAPDFENGRLLFSTGYVYPTKARNAQRNPRVAALFSDPTASGRSEDDPLVLVQGLAEVFDQDLQRNTERYVDQLLRKGPLTLRLMLRTPGTTAGLGWLPDTHLDRGAAPAGIYLGARADCLQSRCVIGNLPSDLFTRAGYRASTGGIRVAATLSSPTRPGLHR